MKLFNLFICMLASFIGLAQNPQLFKTLRICSKYL
jgi:hypothetical protein